MGGLDAHLAEEIAALANDRHSGASTLTRQAHRILASAAQSNCTLEVAAALCRAQPSMASIWNAALTAIAAIEDPNRYGNGESRFRNSQRALERVAVTSLGHAASALGIVTFSVSGSVSSVLRGLHARVPVRVSCSEGRPMHEGRGLAESLSTAGIPVTFYTDAALGQALDDADMLLVGADAVGPSHWINKVGTRLLAAAAQHRGVPVHVLATDDKLVVPELWPYLIQPDHPPSEVWDGAPPAVKVRNPYFEAIVLDLATSVITDKGVLGSDLVRDACAAHDTPALRKALAELLRARGD